MILIIVILLLLEIWILEPTGLSLRPRKVRGNGIWTCRRHTRGVFLPLDVKAMRPLLHSFFVGKSDGEVLHTWVSLPPDLNAVQTYNSLASNPKMLRKKDIPGLERDTTSVTLVMKILPFSCNLACLFLTFGPCDRVLSFLSLLLPGANSLQQSRIDSNR